MPFWNGSPPWLPDCSEGTAMRFDFTGGALYNSPDVGGARAETDPSTSHGHATQAQR